MHHVESLNTLALIKRNLDAFYGAKVITLFLQNFFKGEDLINMEVDELTNVFYDDESKISIAHFITRDHEEGSLIEDRDITDDFYTISAHDCWGNQFDDGLEVDFIVVKAILSGKAKIDLIH